ncbi:hypothetical protein B0P06_000438 [Clostridium saccharoperbutylacetonicum]|uniref:Uncharacterized protein n=1 Tax=Clostridium saccharoperbutylacetonicum N1-4(HMT) TaxID=931276 RepID=M1MGJ1_9CLOT|nr:hypothetical protein [Clostridium saccharoperbutylacetonicum]AGF55468.1 hypothetical protein Cspa_c16980 [Clostridium saccharoperbutylacetonicum N1-4(HMT)]NRT63817.1 hypothetical protein [Clostridium saccharoperbutylacetonicum]NSB27180.1 hypothetical protein [Clostridium saccharoperbutylacetonicum]NSB40667.1 hypothetical protein [Clostridium saccharoperbutylacetonicum]
MFSIEYLILKEEIERVSNITNIKEFDTELNTIEGQISLSFNDEIEGFVDKDIPYADELLFTWFKRLNKVLIYLQTNEFVALSIPERDNVWFEFKRKENLLVINKVKSEQQTSVYDFVTITPIKNIGVLWQEVIVMEEFYNKIINKTKKLLNDIKSYNAILVNSLEYKELKEILEKAQ